MKILTANIALGIAEMATVQGSIRTLIKFHGWRLVPFILFRGRAFGGIFNYRAFENEGRFQYIAARTTLDRTLDLLGSQQPDIVVLQELIYQVHKERVEADLLRLGYRHLAWGVSLHHPGANVAVLIGSKIPGVAFKPLVTQRAEISGGAGIAGMRLKNCQITIIGCHLTAGHRGLWRKQIIDLAKVAASEKQNGRTAFLIGDFNETAKQLQSVEAFRDLQLFSPALPTCLASLPPRLRSDLDHVFVPSNWEMRAETINFGSDHLALSVDVQIPPPKAPKSTMIHDVNSSKSSQSQESVLKQVCG